MATARPGAGRVKRVRFKGDDSSKSELIIKGVTVSRDLLIQAAFLRQRALEQRHEPELEHGFDQRQENQLMTENIEAGITSQSEAQELIVIMAGSSNTTGTQANPSNDRDKMDDYPKARAVMFSADRFTREGSEDVEEFLESVRLSFLPNEVYYRDDRDREKARLLYLSLRLDGKAKKWWTGVSREKRDTWEKASVEMRAEFDVEEEEDITV